MTINSMSELSADLESFVTGALSNKIVDHYVNEMIDTELTMTTQKGLNL